MKIIIENNDNKNKLFFHFHTIIITQIFFLGIDFKIKTIEIDGKKIKL